MGKKIVLLQKNKKALSVDSKILTEYSFAEHFMNINLKLNESQVEKILNLIIPIMSQNFISENGQSLEIFLEKFLTSLEEDTIKQEFCQLKNEKEKVEFFFKHNIIAFQKETKELGFDESIDSFQEFYLLALGQYEKIPLNLILQMNDEFEIAL